MKKLIKQFDREVYKIVKCKPTINETKSFVLGVKMTTEQLHNGLHKAIEKISPNLLKK